MRILQTVQDAENWFSDLKEKVTQMEFYVHFLSTLIKTMH